MVVNFELEMKTKVAVPNSQISKAESTESESVDERSTGSESTETEMSSPVIKVHGSTGGLETLVVEATKAKATLE